VLARVKNLSKPVISVSPRTDISAPSVMAQLGVRASAE